MGRAARTMLVTAAAQQWNVDAGSCQVEKGAVLHRATESGRPMDRWQVRRQNSRRQRK